MDLIEDRSKTNASKASVTDEIQQIEATKITPVSHLSPLLELQFPQKECDLGTDSSASAIAQVKFYTKRWAPAEICGKSISLAGLVLSYSLGANAFVVATVATWAENLGFYGVNTYQRYREEVVSSSTVDQKAINRPKILARAIYETASDFGLSEVVDSLLVRPLGIFASSSIATSYLSESLTSQIIGWTLGTLIADSIFYGLATISHKTKNYLKQRK